MSEGYMIHCYKCKKAINEGEGKTHKAKILCDDCYIDELLPKKQRAHYDNDSEFMQRLKESYPAHPQKYH